MQRNGPSGCVTSSAGDVDRYGDVLNTHLGRRLRGAAGDGHAVNVDLDAHLARVAIVVEQARNRPHLHVLVDEGVAA